jgi:hypothetical protein
VNAGTIAVPSRSDGAHTVARASGVKASAPPTTTRVAQVRRSTIRSLGVQWLVVELVIRSAATGCCDG